MAQFGKVGTSMGKVDNGGNFDRCFFEFLFGQRNKLRPDADSGNVPVRRIGFGTQVFNPVFGVVVAQRGEIQAADENFGSGNVVHFTVLR